jgi:asparagine synthase (glutamine-hydrolysing)
MCGFSFMWSSPALSQKVLGCLGDMNQQIVHRGPDEAGFLLLEQNGRWHRGTHLASLLETASDVRIAMGFRRLAILDLSEKGSQPMLFMDRYAIVFNGEIYNYVELRKELIALGYSFNSDSDTEVILAAFNRWGTDCFGRFNGMWAMAIVDRTEGKLIVSRDRFGVKPLYYYLRDGLLLLASEIKQMLACKGVDITPNESRIRSRFSQDTIEFGPETDFTNVYRFPEASFAVLDLEKGPSPMAFTKYYELPPSPPAGVPFSETAAADYAKTYFELLKDAVKLRLRADVQVATCLSGGLDSSSIVYLIHKILAESNEKSRQKTFSLVFKSADTKYCDESEYIESLTESLALEAYQTEPSLNDVAMAYPDMIYHMENIQHSTLMSYVFTYRLVKSKGVTVTLDGQGADELQAGYLTYLVNHFSNLPVKSIVNEYRQYSRNPGGTQFILRGVMFNIARRAGLKNPARRMLKLFGYRKDPFQTVTAALRQDFNENLKTLLHYGDRGSMMNSVESRFPFMDYRMVEFWMKLPECYKLHNGYTKYVARLAFDKKLPDNIVWRRKKMGWELPQRTWLNGGLLRQMAAEISSNPFVRKLGKQDAYRSGARNNRRLKELIKTYNAAVWHNTYFKKHAP